MVPRNVARISEYVRNMLVAPGSGRIQLALSGGAPTTTGTAESWKKCSWVSASTVWLPGGQNTDPSAGPPSTVPCAVSQVCSLTCSTTAVRTSIVVALVNVGGSGSV